MTSSSADAQVSAAAASGSDANFQGSTPNTLNWVRTRCCGGKSYSFFCPVCCSPLGIPPGVQVPSIQLPLDVEVILKDGRQKSTAIHAAVLAREHVTVHGFDDQALPHFDAATTVIAYPSENALSWDELEDVEQVRTLVLLCCPWRQPAKLLALPQLQGIRHVKIRTTPGASTFWRVPAHDHGHLSTVEALVCLLREYEAHAQVSKGAYSKADGSRFDDLLFFFRIIEGTIRDRLGQEGELPWEASFREKRRAMFIQKARVGAREAGVMSYRYGRPKE
uniref:tRNA-uridine aminocarboxypropyltransferase 1 n=1 Tax=Coccolithus braarudii TaxID=221442 RepID=A0A7S0Q8T6_9EUKA|mmetsp:Transcript_4802/g.10530  ORF Transcript_4802/g.10530 Transcript_4802/m.10530 type:complete len:278 (+) Transcript_4802:18-851(+)